MGLFNLGQKTRIKPKWSLQTTNDDTVVWKLLISPTGILTGEERDLTKKTASLFALEAKSGKILWRGVTLDEAWWFGSELATEERLYLQGFRKPDMPEPKGIYALDIMTGKLDWEQPDLSMLFEHGDRVFALRQGFDRKEYFTIHKRSGEVLEAFGQDTDEVNAVRLLLNDSYPNSLFSTPLDESSEYFDVVKDLLKETLDVKELRGAIDFLEFGKYIVLSYHERKAMAARSMMQQVLSNELRIVDRESGEIVYSDTLNKETPFPVPENFFVNNNVLIYVKEKRELLGVPLL